MITIYGIKSCDTVRKARKYLELYNLSYTYHDFRTDGLNQEKLSHWITQAGWEKLLNTRSTSWRNLDEQLKQNISKSSALQLMLQNPTLIKRPILEHDNNLLIGFKEADYKQLT